MESLTKKIEELVNQIDQGEIEAVGILVRTKAGTTSLITSNGFSPTEFQEALAKTSSIQQNMLDALNNLPC